MFRKSKLCSSLAVILFFTMAAVCFGDTDEPALDVSRSGYGARPLALGRAFTGLADDSNAILFNPAGLAYLKSPQAMNINTRLLADVNYTTYLVAWPTEFGTFGAGYISAGVDNIYIGDWTSPAETDTRVTSKASYASAVSILSYGKALDEQLALGVNLKFFNNGFAGLGQSDAEASGQNVDVGLLYRFDPRWQAGLFYQNAYTAKTLTWGTGEQEIIESYMRLGVAYREKDMFFFSRFNWLADMEVPAVTAYRQIGYHTGVEGWIADILAIRVGIGTREHSHNGQMLALTEGSIGLGLNLWGVQIDYTYLPGAADLGDKSERYFLSLAYQLPGAADWSRADNGREEEKLAETKPAEDLVIREMTVSRPEPGPEHFRKETLVLRKNIVETRDVLGAIPFDPAHAYFEIRGQRTNQARFYPGENWLTYKRTGEDKPRLVKILVLADYGDVRPGDPAYTDIQALTCAGVLQGQADNRGLFAPQEQVSQAELQGVIDRMRADIAVPIRQTESSQAAMTRAEAVYLVANNFREDKERFISSFPEETARNIRAGYEGGYLTRAEMARLLARTGQGRELVGRVAREYAVSFDDTHLSASAEEI
jgi:hypothetical protein